MAELRVLTAMQIEARAVGGDVCVMGVGRERATRSAGLLAASMDPGTPFAVVGVAGGLDPELRPGQVVVADTVRATGGIPSSVLPNAPVVAAELRRFGFDVRTGPIVSSPRMVRGSERAALAGTGALAVDMESAWAADALRGAPVVVVRAIADTAERGPVLGGARALGSLLRIRPVLEDWARATGTRQVLLAAPRSFCAGVDRAIEIVERALSKHGAPVYVRRQIVHNSHVVRSLELKGAVFVEELDEVPPGSTVVLAAHGVTPAVRHEAEARGDLAVIDATCPLVAKVHVEARRFRSQGRQIVLVGHEDHEEVIGTSGEAPGQIHVVGHVGDVDHLPIGPGEQVAYLTQTTLALDETAEIVAALEERFPGIVGPGADDICYATQNRQNGVRALAPHCDLVLVVGSANSSNTARLVEVARREGVRAELVEDASQIRLRWLEGVTTVGVTAGASAPESLVEEVIGALGALGPLQVREHEGVAETVRFTLPSSLR